MIDERKWRLKDTGMFLQKIFEVGNAISSNLYIEYNKNFSGYTKLV